MTTETKQPAPIGAASALTDEEVQKIRARMDYIEAHADEGGTGSPANLQEFVDLVRHLLPGKIVERDSGAVTERALADLIAEFYRQKIGVSMQQAEHWAKENFPLAVHHRVRSADTYYQVVAKFENYGKWGKNPFDEMRESVARGSLKLAGAYPPSLEIHQYRNPVYVVEKLKTAPKEAGGQGSERLK